MKIFIGAVLLAAILTGLVDFTSAVESQSQNSNDEVRPVGIVDVWYLTLRNQNNGQSNDEIYGGSRGVLRSGICSIEFQQIPGLKEIANSTPFYIPEEKIKLQSISKFSENRFWQKIKAFAENNQGNIVFYVHGYNIGFEKSCWRAATFQRAMNLNHRLILFSWPADGNLLKYTWDEADLVWSVPKMAYILQEIVQRVGSGKVDVVAHSLGARGVIMALSKILCNYPAESFLNELILVAPDIDTDNFRNEWPAIRRLAKRTTLYVSENDKALKVSHEVHGYPRLGEADEHLTVIEGIETIDISPSGKRRFSGHLYHLYNPAVVLDLTILLDTGNPASRRPNLIKVTGQKIPYWRLTPNDP